MGDKAAQVLKLVLTALGILCKNFFCSDSNFKPIIYCHFTAPAFMRPYSQRQFVEESEISKNPIKCFQSIFRVLCNMHI